MKIVTVEGDAVCKTGVFSCDMKIVAVKGLLRVYRHIDVSGKGMDLFVSRGTA